MDDTVEALSTVQKRLFELFIRLCGDPDDSITAAQADQTLHELDYMLERTR